MRDGNDFLAFSSPKSRTIGDYTAPIVFNLNPYAFRPVNLLSTLFIAVCKHDLKKSLSVNILNIIPVTARLKLFLIFRIYFESSLLNGISLVSSPYISGLSNSPLGYDNSPIQ